MAGFSDFRPFHTRALLRIDGILDPAYHLEVFDGRVGCNVLKCWADGWEADADDGDARFNDYQLCGVGDGVCGVEQYQRNIDDVVIWEKKLQTREILEVEAADRSHAKGSCYTDPTRRHAISEICPYSQADDQKDAQSVRRDQASDDNAGNANLEHGEDAYVKEEDRYLGGDEARLTDQSLDIHSTDQAKGNPESPVVGANGKSDSPSRGDT
ncbi:MAG: hypothetical protein Q9192_005756 [Flavoplaca navasiana]